MYYKTVKYLPFEIASHKNAIVFIGGNLLKPCDSEIEALQARVKELAAPPMP
jgi:hypothetical protein